MKRIRIPRPRKKMILLLPFIALLVAGGLAAASGQVVLGRPPATPLPPSQNGDLDMPQNLRLALQSDTLSAEGRASLETNLAQTERMAARPTPAVVNNLPPVILPTVALPVSPASLMEASPAQETIMNGSEVLVHGWEASVQNMWVGERNGVYYEVVAGASADDPSQGWIKVFETGQDQWSQKVYLSPEKNGAVRVLEVQGTRMVFSTGSGRTVAFDLATRSFQP
jgi:hypothetical protein